MNNYTLSSIIAFILFGMGVISLIRGYSVWVVDKKSKSARKMLLICICTFLWNFGYAWMSMCHGDEKWALFARAIALLSVFAYMVFVLDYVVHLSKYPRRIYNIFITLCIICSFYSWTQIIRPSAITFVEVPWGYWYTSKFSVARIVQFAAILASLIFYYTILSYWKKNSVSKRYLFIIKSFMWFGPILFSGYIADTLFPTIFKTAAIPGSSIGAFFSMLLLFKISEDYKAFDITVQNVSELVFREVNTPVIIFDADDNIVLCNQETEIFFGLTKHEILVSTRDSLFVPSNTFKNLYEVPNMDKYYRLDTSNILDRFDETLYKIAFVSDMTSEQNTMKVLDESRKNAEAANLAKSNFLANMSHEIRTPMNAILGMSDIVLMDASLSEEARNSIHDIKTAGTNLVSIINDILNISKIESGKLELITGEYSLASILQDINSMMTIQVHQKDIAFNIELDSTLPDLLIGDSTKIREILINIIGNATKFTNKGSIKLTINWNEDKKSPLITFKVTDTGIGIKAEDIDKIFGTFNQVDTRKNRNVEGTGLGLAISKKLAILMGGDITVESKYGEGSTFTITIIQEIAEYKAIGPKNAEAIIHSHYRTAAKEEQKSDFADKSKYKVLVVDDNKVNLRVAKGVLKPYKVQLVTATSGFEAIAKIQEEDFDLILMDHMMPEMDGVDTAKNIKQLAEGKYASIPIIAVTANTLDDQKEFLLANGMDDFLAKPINREELDVIINKWLA